jgi:hypothetical protein
VQSCEVVIRAGLEGPVGCSGIGRGPTERAEAAFLSGRELHVVVDRAMRSALAQDRDTVLQCQELDELGSGIDIAIGTGVVDRVQNNEPSARLGPELIEGGSVPSEEFAERGRPAVDWSAAYGSTQVIERLVKVHFHVNIYGGKL